MLSLALLPVDFVCLLLYIKPLRPIRHIASIVMNVFLSLSLDLSREGLRVYITPCVALFTARRESADL